MLGLLINFLLEPVLIFKLQYGVIGAGISNLASSLIPGIIALISLKKILPPDLKLDIRELVKFLKLSIPMIGSSLSEGVGGTLFTYILSLISLRLVGLWGAAEVILGVIWMLGILVKLFL